MEYVALFVMFLALTLIVCTVGALFGFIATADDRSLDWAFQWCPERHRQNARSAVALLIIITFYMAAASI